MTPASPGNWPASGAAEEATRAGDEFARHVQFGGGADEAGHATAAANDFAAEATRKG